MENKNTQWEYDYSALYRGGTSAPVPPQNNWNPQETPAAPVQNTWHTQEAPAAPAHTAPVQPAVTPASQPVQQAPVSQPVQPVPNTWHTQEAPAAPVQPAVTPASQPVQASTAAPAQQPVTAPAPQPAQPVQNTWHTQETPAQAVQASAQAPQQVNTAAASVQQPVTAPAPQPVQNTWHTQEAPAVPVHTAPVQPAATPVSQPVQQAPVSQPVQEVPNTWRTQEAPAAPVQNTWHTQEMPAQAQQESHSVYRIPGAQAKPADIETGYVNVGSTGTNTANTAAYSYDDGVSWQGVRQESVYTSTSGASDYVSAEKPRREKKKPGTAVRVLGRVLSLVLVAAIGFGSGWLGSYMQKDNGGSHVVVHTTDRTLPGATDTSTGGRNLTLPEVSALASPSVVVITTEQMVSTGSWFGMNSVQSGAGSGVVLSSDGYILTCAHVVSGASNVIVTIDDEDYNAILVGADEESDIAVVKIDVTGLTPAVLADSDTLSVGEEVVAVGNPLGILGGTVTNGIISALNRTVSVEGKAMTLIQTNASVSPGNSGGGLFNMSGELIGIVNAKSSDIDAEGLGFAIPSNTALQVAQDLIETGYVTGRPAMGVTVLAINDADTAARYGVSSYGVYIAAVTEGSGADRAGLQVGDRVVSIDDTEVSVIADLTDAISEHKVGDVVALTVARNGRMLQVKVELGEKNAQSASNRSETEKGGDLPFGGSLPFGSGDLPFGGGGR